VGTSFLIASLVGISLAIVAHKSITAQNIIMPIINIMRPIPNIVWLPIIIVIIPSSEMSILAIPFISALPPIFLSAFTGLERIPSGIKNQAIIKNISGAKEIFGILIPGAFSHIRNGVNVGIGIAWMGVVLAEMTAGKNGIGYFTWIAYQSTNYSYMLIGAIIIAISGFLSSKIFLKITKKSFHGLYI
jgi:NitT/TauT family transport system permease protein